MSLEILCYNIPITKYTTVIDTLGFSIAQTLLLLSKYNMEIQ